MSWNAEHARRKTPRPVWSEALDVDTWLIAAREPLDQPVEQPNNKHVDLDEFCWSRGLAESLRLAALRPEPHLDVIFPWEIVEIVESWLTTYGQPWSHGEGTIWDPDYDSPNQGTLRVRLERGVALIQFEKGFYDDEGEWVFTQICRYNTWSELFTAHQHDTHADELLWDELTLIAVALQEEEDR